MSGFQLVYNESSASGAFAWEKTTGIHHYRIEDGEGEKFNPTPVLVPHAAYDNAAINERFENAASEIDRIEYGGSK